MSKLEENFVRLVGEDRLNNPKEFYAHIDQIAYIIEGNVYLKGHNNMAEPALKVGEFDVKNLKVAEKTTYGTVSNLLSQIAKDLQNKGK
jgi:hypothetical protein